MRFVGLFVLCSAAASAQTHVDGAGTAGVAFRSPGESVAVQTALDAQIERSFESSLTASARLVAQLLANTKGELTFQDLSSSVRVQFRLPSWDTGAVYLELFPFDGRRVHPSFDFANSWGAPVRPMSVAPLVTAGFVRRNVSIWAAASAYPQLDNSTLEQVLRWTGMFGGGLLLPLGWRTEAILTVADRGGVPGLGNQGIKTSVLAYGASTRLSWQSGGGVGAVLDPASLAKDPDRFTRLFARESYQTPRAIWVGLEAGFASQNLEDPDIFGMMRREFSGYADFQARLRLEALRLFVTVRLRPTRFISFDVPGIPPFKEFPRGTVTQDEYAALLGADFRLKRLGLTPSLVLRMIRPATFKTPTELLSGGNNPPVSTQSRVVVIDEALSFTLLPMGEQALPRFDATASLLFDRFEPFSALLRVGYFFDPNRSLFLAQTAGVAELWRLPLHLFSASLYLQLRF